MQMWSSFSIQLFCLFLSFLLCFRLHLDLRKISWSLAVNAPLRSPAGCKALPKGIKHVKKFNLDLKLKLWLIKWTRRGKMQFHPVNNRGFMETFGIVLTRTTEKTAHIKNRKSDSALLQCDQWDILCCSKPRKALYIYGVTSSTTTPL